MTYAQHNHCLMHLFAVQKFGKIKLDLKKKGVAFSQCEIQILCENIHALSEIHEIKGASSVQRPVY